MTAQVADLAKYVTTANYSVYKIYPAVSSFFFNLVYKEFPGIAAIPETEFAPGEHQEPNLFLARVFGELRGGDRTNLNAYKACCSKITPWELEEYLLLRRSSRKIAEASKVRPPHAMPRARTHTHTQEPHDRRWVGRRRTCAGASGTGRPRETRRRH